MISFTLVFFRWRLNAGAVHEDDLPVACLLFEEGRFQPILLGGTGSIAAATFIDVGLPGGIAAVVHIGFGHVPLVTLARGVLGINESHNAVSFESGTAVENVEVCGNDGIELRHIVGGGGGKDLLTVSMTCCSWVPALIFPANNVMTVRTNCVVFIKAKSETLRKESRPTLMSPVPQKKELPKLFLQLVLQTVRLSGFWK